MSRFDDWLVHEMMGPGERPEATFLALEGDDVIGYASWRSRWPNQRRRITT
jgi:hypothetical protein